MTLSLARQRGGRKVEVVDRLGLPCLQAQPGDSPKYTQVVCHQDDIQRDRLAGNQQVIGTDAPPLFFQFLTDIRRRPRGLLVERDQDEGGKEEFHPRPFLGRKTTSRPGHADGNFHWETFIRTSSSNDHICSNRSSDIVLCQHWSKF